MPSPRLDVLIQHLPGQVIPEAGLPGRAFRPQLFSLAVDPANPSLQQGGLQRHILHQVHHCMRMAGPGDGLTAREALVSEGLAR